jgi:hypothetical protein
MGDNPLIFAAAGGVTMQPCLGALGGDVLTGMSAVLLGGAAVFGIGWALRLTAPAHRWPRSVRAPVLVTCMIAGWWLAARLLLPAGGK